MSARHFARRGLLVILSSPSGAGKSTISRLLLDSERDMSLSISVTTRARRPSEVEGVHYHFVTMREFEKMRDRGELLEWAEVHGNCYGTPRDPVEASLSDGSDVLFDIDWQGAEQITGAMPDDVVSIFVLPPSGSELKSRLVRRAEDDEATILRRLANAREELGHYSDYDYVVVNDDLESALEGVRAILHAERLRRRRLVGVDGFVDGIVKAL
ncbi:guanylate kinase [Acuticoccus sp. I52.16.1]|uniref:guanylate kinase n=1 Tax=Acuticoccus sp. I52.16.1 TaxID=2928472 RepID=UPI001FD3055E|nr:guanylate kinase [Acuticoccus sp. I52.16.1]UOM33885.1 guanylate kinase [Acuticoccus sp. I52.16.1]